MARQTFSESWLPLFGSDITKKPEVTKTSFGDGYEVRQASGINFIKEQWALTFEVGVTDSNAIDAFLTARGGVESFYWKNPRSITLTVVCDDWKIVRNQGYNTITATFRQVFES